MPNICEFDAKVKGKKKDVLKLVDWFRAHYDYSDKNNGLKCWTVEKNDEKVPCEHHIGFRVFQTELVDDFSDYDDNEVVTGTIFGDCAWSVCGCVMEGQFSYISRNQEDKDKYIYCISLPDACKKLKVEIELFSREPGCGFSEHYYINKKGEVEIDEEAEYSEIFVSCLHEDYGSYEEYVCSCKENEKVVITPLQWEDKDAYFCVCNFMDANENYIYQEILD